MRSARRKAGSRWLATRRVGPPARSHPRPEEARRAEMERCHTRWSNGAPFRQGEMSVVRLARGGGWRAPGPSRVAPLPGGACRIRQSRPRGCRGRSRSAACPIREHPRGRAAGVRARRTGPSRPADPPRRFFKARLPGDPQGAGRRPTAAGPRSRAEVGPQGRSGGRRRSPGSPLRDRPRPRGCSPPAYPPKSSGSSGEASRAATPVSTKGANGASTKPIPFQRMAGSRKRAPAAPPASTARSLARAHFRYIAVAASLRRNFARAAVAPGRGPNSTANSRPEAAASGDLHLRRTTAAAPLRRAGARAGRPPRTCRTGSG